jgi:Ion channel
VPERFRRLRAEHSYWAVLGMVVAALLFAAVAPDSDAATSVLVLLESATLGLALWTAGWTAADSTVSFALAVLGAVAASVNLAWSGTGLTAAVSLLSGLLVIATMFVIARGAIRQGEVNTRSLAGAICVYLLIGMAFLFFYGVAATLGDGDFFAQGTDGTRSLRLYFSYVTLATLGYGDYTPAGDLARVIAVFEALLGQLYLVTVVAVVVTRLGVNRRPR